MIFAVLLSVTFTFSATATGVEKGTPVEFVFVGNNSDRAYESMFILDEPIEILCKKIESAIPRGSPVDPKTCRLWPTGCRVCFDPPFDQFIETELQEAEKPPIPIYTGGTLLTNGIHEAANVMPSSFFATYSLPQSPIVFRDSADQGMAYGRFTSARSVEKGKRYTFKMIVEEDSLPPRIELTAEKGNLRQLLTRLKTASAVSDIDANISFSESLTVEDSIAIAKALSVIDSARVKINGPNRLFYRAFLPLEKWRDRQERIQQPFELTLKEDGTDELLFIEEDWTVEGNDPKLTPRQISFQQTKFHSNTDTCFIFSARTERLSRIYQVMRKFETRIVNWYVFTRE